MAVIQNVVYIECNNPGRVSYIDKTEPHWCYVSPSLIIILFSNFPGWTNSMFLDMCLLAGCDYLPGIHGIGIITAHKSVGSTTD